MTTARDPLPRFEKFLDRGEGDCCWFWKGTRNGNGVALFSLRGKTTTAVRVAFELLHQRAIGEDERVRNQCGNLLCVRPDHFSLASKHEPMRPLASAQMALVPMEEAMNALEANITRAGLPAERRVEGPKLAMRLHPAPKYTPDLPVTFADIERLRNYRTGCVIVCLPGSVTINVSWGAQEYWGDSLETAAAKAITALRRELAEAIRAEESA